MIRASQYTLLQGYMRVGHSLYYEPLILGNPTINYYFQGGAPHKLLVHFIIWNHRAIKCFGPSFTIKIRWSEVLERLQHQLEKLITRFWCSSPRWWEYYILSHRNTVTKGWLFPSWLVGQQKFTLLFLSFQRKQLCAGNPTNHLHITVHIFTYL